MIGRNAQAVLDALAGCESFEDVRAAGILFHGTCEAIEGDLRGGPYDGVFWTAPSPSVAQSYIPRSGITGIMPDPDDYDRDERIRPDKRDSWVMRWAFEKSGATREDLAVEWDGWRAYSWTIPEGWPTMGDLADHMRELGYAPDHHGNFTYFTCYEGEEEVLKPADWFLPGHLLIVLPEDLEIREPEWSEDALGYANHNRVGDFTSFAMKGHDAFRMSDQLQSDHLGNVGHQAIGILSSGRRKLSWLAIPAVRHDGEDLEAWRRPETEEFAEFMRRLNPLYRTVAEIEAEAELTAPELSM